MKIILLSLTIIAITFLIPPESVAQTSTVNGEVFTFDTIPLINANIKVKSTKQEVNTDNNGKFTVECESDDVLTISANGFDSEKIKLKNVSGNINVNLALKSGEKYVEAAINSGHIKNVEHFKVLADKINSGEDFSVYANVYEIIEAKFPGVQINQGYLIIRGGNRLNVSSADNAALIVVDGITNDNSILSTLPTSLIKNIQILKDGSNAKYGARGTNGVVLIETKR